MTFIYEIFAIVGWGWFVVVMVYLIWKLRPGRTGSGEGGEKAE